MSVREPMFCCVVTWILGEHEVGEQLPADLLRVAHLAEEDGVLLDALDVESERLGAARDHQLVVGDLELVRVAGQLSVNGRGRAVHLVRLGVDAGAGGEEEVGAGAGGERRLDAADGLDDGAELERADARGRQQRREHHVVPGRHAHDVVGARVHVLEQPARRPPGAQHHDARLLPGPRRAEARRLARRRRHRIVLPRLRVRELRRHRRGRRGVQPRGRGDDAPARRLEEVAAAGGPSHEAVERRHVLAPGTGQRGGTAQRGSRLRRCRAADAALVEGPRQGLRQRQLRSPPDPRPRRRHLREQLLQTCV